MEWVGAPLVEPLLWAVAAVATIWIVGPGLVFLLRLGRVEVLGDVDEDVTHAEPDGTNAAYEVKYRAFVALGFRPIGKTIQRAWFFSPLHWLWRSHGMRWLVSEDRKVFVILFRVGGGGPWKTAALSVFEGGGFLETACSNAGIPVTEGDQRRIEITEVEPRQLVACHATFAAQLSRERGLPARSATLREISAATNAFSGRHLPRFRLGVSTYPILLVFLIPLWTALHAHGPAGARARPLMICAAAAAFAFVRWVVKPGPISMFIRFGLFFAVSSVVPIFSIIPTLSQHTVERSLDRLDAAARAGGSPAVVDRMTERFTAGYDSQVCPAVLRRFADPAVAPETRRALHRILVHWRGGDLGDGEVAWQTWCAQVPKGRRW